MNFADLSHEEYKSKYFGPNVEFPRKRSTHGFSYRDVEDLLESVDWRSREAVTPVKNQGSCGSFGAFSTVAAVESINQIAWSTMTEASTMDAMAGWFHQDQTVKSLGCPSTSRGIFTGRCGTDMEHGVTAGGYGSSQGTNYIYSKEFIWTKLERMDILG
ncbi:Cysteine protease XCP1, partial [Cucurbita argyrosperma subsp. sororia]